MVLVKRALLAAWRVDHPKPKVEGVEPRRKT